MKSEIQAESKQYNRILLISLLFFLLIFVLRQHISLQMLTLFSWFLAQKSKYWDNLNIRLIVLPRLPLCQQKVLKFKEKHTFVLQANRPLHELTSIWILATWFSTKCILKQHWFYFASVECHKTPTKLMSPSWNIFPLSLSIDFLNKTILCIPL